MKFPPAPGRSGTPILGWKWPMTYVLIIVTVVKIVLAAVLGGTADIRQTYSQAQAFLSGMDIYDEISTGGPAFFPIGHYLLASASLLASNLLGLPFAFIIKVPSILADLLIAFLLRSLSNGGNHAALLYMLSPVIFIISVKHGQLHTVAVLFAVFCLWLADRKRFDLAALALIISASIRQHWAILIIPLAAKHGKKGLMLIVAFSGLFLLINTPLVFNSNSPGNIFQPTWTYGSWGYSVILIQGSRVLNLFSISGNMPIVDSLNDILMTHGSMIYWVWSIIFSILVWLHRDVDLWDLALLFILGIYILSPGFGVQWLVWLVPFLMVYNQRSAIHYSIAAAVFVGAQYWWQWGLNAKYGVSSITQNLSLLTINDLIGLVLVGALGVLIWAYLVKIAYGLIHNIMQYESRS